MKKINQLMFLLMALFFMAIPQQAAAETEREPVTLDAVVVTADRAETPFETGDVDTELTPGFFSVINREAFEGKTESLSEVIEKELLHRVPARIFQRSGHGLSGRRFAQWRVRRRR